MALPKSPENLICSVDETKLFTVVYWDKVTEDVDDNATTVLSYKIYKTEKSNLRDFELVGTITTTDIDGDVDTILVDTTVDLVKNNYYKVSAVNADGEGESSDLIFDLVKLDMKNG